MRQGLAVVLLVCVLPTVAGAAEPRRAHGTHGTVRLLCQAAPVKRWPGGPVVGIARRHQDVRRYSYRGHWALGVTMGRPRLYGYVEQRRFCPPSAAGRRALEADRRPSSVPSRRTSRPLPVVLHRRVCSTHVWVRDRPLDRAIGILWLGDVFVARRAARNPWFGGDALGHEREQAWIPRAALCGPLPRRPAGSHLVRAGAVTLLAPATTLPCGTAQPRPRLLEVGADHLRRGRPVRADLEVGTHVHRGPVFAPGQPASLARGAVGPFRCGRTAHVVYRSLGAGGRVLARFAVHIAPKREPHDATARAAAEPTSATARPPGTACAAPPTLRYAHGHAGPVSHRYDARPAVADGATGIAFDTPLRLLRADRDGARDVYLRRGDGRLLLVSGTSRTNRAPAISADAARVAYESDAPGRERRVLLWDRAAGTRPVGQQEGRTRAPSLSADGRTLAYEATAPQAGVWVEDLTTGARRLVVAGAYRPALSADGTTLTVETDRALVPADRNRTVDVYAVRLAGGAPVLVSVARGGGAGAGRSVAAVPSGDGRFVAFMSAAPDLVRGDRDGLRDVFRRDLRRGVTVLVSRDRCGGFANGYSRYPSISADGRRIAFDSHAADIVRGDARGEGEVYVRDMARGRTRLMSLRPDGRPSRRTAFSPALARDGSVVAFPSFGADLVPHDVNRRVDQFARRVDGVRVRRVS